MHKIFAILIIFAAGLYPSSLPAMATLLDYSDTSSGYSFQYPDYWALETDPSRMLDVQDGSIDLIREELIPESELNSYKVMVHVPSDPKYLSNTVFIVKSLPNNRNYSTAEDALNAVVADFEDNKESGTYSLQDTWLGESHAYLYRRAVSFDSLAAKIQVTYYVTASKTRAYMIVETVYLGTQTEERLDLFNQVIMSFRVDDNEVIPPEDAVPDEQRKPGDTDPGPTMGLGEVEEVEEFENNRRGWPVSDSSNIQDGAYVLDSRERGPFTVQNTSLGYIGFDFSYDGQVTFVGGSENDGYGLVFGYRDPDNYFAFLITKNGQFTVVEERQGEYNILVPWAELNIPDGTTHTLSIQGDYHTIKDTNHSYEYALMFFIDNTHAVSIPLDRILDVDGGFGVFVSAGLQVSFDSLTARNYLLGGEMYFDVLPVP